MTYESFKSVGYSLMIEDNPKQKTQYKLETYAAMVFESKRFSIAQLKKSIYLKLFVAKYMAFLEFTHVFWQGTKTPIIRSDNKLLTRFFQTKATPRSLWKACNHMPQYNYKIDLNTNTGSVNTAVGFISTLALKVMQKIQLKIQKGLQTTPVDVKMSCSNVTD